MKKNKQKSKNIDRLKELNREKYKEDRDKRVNLKAKKRGEQ